MIWGLSLHGWEDIMRGSLAIVGVFGLLVGVSTFFVVRLQREEIAASNERVAELNNETARLEKVVAGRQFTTEQISSIAVALNSFAGRKVYLSSYSGDAEGVRFALQIKMALEKSKILVEDLVGKTVVGQGIAGGGGLRFGIHVEGVPSDDDLIAAIGGALEKNGGFNIGTITRPAMIIAERATLLIMVGLRPL